MHVSWHPLIIAHTKTQMFLEARTTDCLLLSPARVSSPAKNDSYLILCQVLIDETPSTKRWPNIVSMLGQRLRRWPNIETMLSYIFVWILVFMLCQVLSDGTSGRHDIQWHWRWQALSLTLTQLTDMIMMMIWCLYLQESCYLREGILSHTSPPPYFNDKIPYVYRIIHALLLPGIQTLL